MLVLSRRLNEKLIFPGINATLQVVSVKPGVVRLGIEAPPQVQVFREEVLLRSTGAAAAPPQAEAAGQLALRRLMHRANNRLNANAVGLALLRRQLELGRAQEALATLGRLEEEAQGLRDALAETSEQLCGPAPSPRRRALLVEDDHNECALLAGFLRLAGLEVDTAGDGCDALDHLRSGRRRPDFVLMDMVLPRCDGPSTVRAIRRDPNLQGLRIFGVSGEASNRFGLEDGPAGIDRWFRKPLNPERLLREINQDLPPPGDAAP